MKYGIAKVAQNAMTINYSPMVYGNERAMALDVCDKLNKHASATWERLKLDSDMWRIIQDAYISGDSFAYFYDKDGQVQMEIVDNTNVLLADEQNPDIQGQPYILIVQRRYVDEVKEEAEQNGIEKSDIDMIIADDETSYQINAKTEVKNEKKCISILKMYKKDGIIHIAKSTKTVIYQPDTPIKAVMQQDNPLRGNESDLTALSLYPLAKYSWRLGHNSARGTGDIYDKIPNQIEVNKGIARLCVAAKEFSYPHIIYDESKIDQSSIEQLNVVGSKIAIKNFDGQSISNVVGYMQAQNINPLAKDIITDLIQQTRDLAGAGEAVTGQVNPERASGAAIIAVQDAAALPLNMQVSEYKQFVEDMAMVWFDMWIAYNPNGISVVADDDIEVTITPDVLHTLKS